VDFPIKNGDIALLNYQRVHHVFFSRGAQNCNAIIVLTPLVPWPKIWVVHPFWKKPNASRENQGTMHSGFNKSLKDPIFGIEKQ
jgi:hypothetical protein